MVPTPDKKTKQESTPAPKPSPPVSVSSIPSKPANSQKDATATPAGKQSSSGVGTVLAAAPAGRITSIDAYRGLVMILLAAEGFGLAKTSKNFPENPVWQQIGLWFEHVPWVGCSVWDMIQPSFMFLVGVSVPWSIASRTQRGVSTTSRWLGAVVRSLVLIVLGVFLISNSHERTYFSFVNVLTQIGLGYLVVYALAGRGWIVQSFVIVLILAGYWGAFAQYPFGTEAMAQAWNIPQDDWQKFGGFQEHWNKHLNAAGAFDRWFLNLFPQNPPYEFNKGGYQTLNFIPSIVTMGLGLIAGELLRKSTSAVRAAFLLIGIGIVVSAIGIGLHYGGVCPIVKRIWTPSWTLFSGGICLMLLGLFHAVTDGLRWKGGAFPLVVAGANPIVLYVLYMLLRPWTAETWKRHLGSRIFNIFGEAWSPCLQDSLAGITFWLFVYYLYRQRIFVRI